MSKKATKKAAKKKPAAKKAPKKTVKTKTAKKPAKKVVKKTAPKKAIKKAVAKKATPKKSVKKATPKKAVVKKAAPKKAVAKKTISKKVAVKQVAPEKVVTKKAIVPKQEPLKAAPAKIDAVTKKAVIKKTKKMPVAKTQPAHIIPITKLGADSPELLKAIVEGLEERKAKNITVINLNKINNRSFDYFVVADADSNTHVESIASSVEEEVKKKLQERPYHTEGWQNAEWILLDYINIVVHVFQRPVREFYNLEGLWADAEIQKIN